MQARRGRAGNLALSFEQRRHPLQVKLCVEAWDETPELSADELAQRLLRHFSSAVIDKERGNTHVQEGLDRLISLGVPEVILESHRSFGNVVFASVGEARSAGAVAASYLYRMWPPLGDAVFFDVQGGADEAAASAIAGELGEALGMVPCPEVAGGG
jgi:hypothetical protein